MSIKDVQEMSWCTDLVAFAEAWHELVVQLIEMTQITSTI